eukprot:CAMPEP_0179340826 /NCGR_PEP_ID=MMETSP0797-20121207/69491_1 /TAXON_ID=47934 /ORGANISM="Dinophysis acuminata, Strain DAEP01" /LENGTH=295 /DNA_ID=CAMNT_0021054821 /DNA_START=22 /DNA_END=905 /DNA_ORIENTATION=+
MSNDKSSKYVHRAARSERRRGGAAAAPRGWASSLPLPEEAQHAQEELDDVEVEVERGEHVVVDAELELVRRVPPRADDHLRVVDDVEDEEDDADDVVEHHGHVHVDAARAEDRDHEAEREHREERAKEVRSASREVGLRHARVGREAQEHDDGHAGSQDDTLPCVHRADEADHDALEGREGEEENVVCRVLPRDVAAAGHRDHGDERHRQGEVEEPGVVLQPHLVHRRQGRGDGGGDQELHREDAVDLPDEAVPDLGVRVLDALGHADIAGALRVALGVLHRFGTTTARATTPRA